MKNKKLKQLTPFHMLNEGGKKTLTSTPLPFNSKKKRKKNQGAPAPLKQ
jgi:hypothetical protein